MPEPASVIAARQLAEEARDRPPRPRRRRRPVPAIPSPPEEGADE